jgi:hypothetical protein
VKLGIFFGLVIKTHERDRENQENDLLNSLKSQSFSTYQSFRPRDIFPHLKDLLCNILIVLIVVKSLDTVHESVHKRTELVHAQIERKKFEF